MPYIEKNKRDVIAFQSDYGPVAEYLGTNELLVHTIEIEKPGELNYAITMLCKDYLDNAGHSYTMYNEVIGVLECAKLELYRRLAAPYEDEKIKENGDVY